MSEVHVFKGSAEAGANNPFAYPTGERHAVLIFLRGEQDADFDWQEASLVATDRGYQNVIIERGGIVDPAEVATASQSLRNSYDQALCDGNSLIVYNDPIPQEATT